MTRIGTGYVAIEPDWSGFDGKVRARLAALDDEFNRVGRSSGRRFSDGFDDKRTTRALDDVRDRVRNVDRETRRASKGFEGLANAAGGGGGLRNAGRNLDAFGGAAAGATATIGGFRVALAALVPITIGFGGASVAAASSLGPLIGLAAAAGNAFASAAQGMGVFKLATMGVADALKEQVDKQGKVASAAISTAGQQRAAARSIQSAQDGLRDATRSASDAVLEQTKAIAAVAPAASAARMWLNDLREAVVDAGLSLRSAKLAADDARSALADLLGGPDPRKLADAHRAVTDAVRGEDTAVQALRDAYKALDELLKPPDVLDVADATDAVADSVRNEERARLNLNAQIKKTNDILADQPGYTTDEAKAQARLDLAEAENAVGDASRQSERARQGLVKVEAGPEQAAVEAARRHVSEAEDGVKRAAASTTAARKDLAELEKPATAQELAHARLEVAQAENAVGDAERDRLRSSRDLADAERLGISRSPEVVAARDAVTKANRDVEDSERAVTRAEQALSDAQLSAKESMASAALAATNLNEKFDKLPPAAKAFVLVLKDMKPQLDQLRQTAAAGFFPGATEGLQAAAKNFGSVNKVVGETATVLGEAARKSGELVGSPAFGKDLETIGGRNAKVLDTLGEALRHVVSALRYVALAAGPLTQHLADLVNGWARNAAEAAKAGEETGKLADFFEKTRAITERLLSVIGHLASGLVGVGKAGKKTGDGIWKSIDRAAARFDEWANSTKGQEALKDFFEETRRLAAALVPVIAGITGGVAFFVLKLAPLLSEILETLGPYADEATTAFIAFKFASYGVAAASAAAAFATGGWVTAFWALNGALFANPIGLVVAAIVGLVGAGYLIIKNWDEIVAALGKAWNWIKQAATDTFEWVKTAVSDSWEWIKTATTDTWNTVSQVFSDGVKVVIDGITAAAQWFVDAGKNMVRWIVDGVKAMAAALADAAGWVKNRVVEGIQALVEAFKSVGSWVLNRIMEGFKLGSEALATVGGWLKNRVEEFVHNAVEGFKAVGSWLLNRIVEGVTGGSEALGAVGGWLKNRFMDAVNAAKDGFLNVGKSILEFIVDGMKSGGRLLLGFVNDIIGIVNKLLGAIGVDKIELITAKSVGLAEGGVHGLARGGAFERTGGIIDRPMVLFGEEAPVHKEWVIPENPAYRDRARMLLMQAWKSIGFASGGRYSQKDMEELWAKHGGGDVKIAGAVGMAESGGDPNAGRSHPYHGLWQVGPGGPFDPDLNAIAAIAKWRAGGASVDARWRPWEAYTGPDGVGSDGPWRQFLNGDKDGGGLLGKIAGAIGDLLSKGAGFLLDKLPGVGGLPNWLHGIGEFLLDKVGGWIKDKVSDAIGLGGGDGAPSGGVSGSVQGAMALAREMGLQITSTTGGQHAANSWHYKGRAADVAGTPAQMAAFYRAALGRYGSHLLELFYDPIGAIKNGKSIPAIGGHSDHVHIALAQGGVFGGDDAPPFGGSFAMGGIVPGPVGSPVLIEAHGGESVMPQGEMRDLVQQLRALNASPTIDVIRALVGVVNTQQGRSARHQSMTAGLGGFPAIP